MIEITHKSNCPGCHACATICPKHCITMRGDSEGFLYPYIDTNICNSCGLCEKVCHVLNRQIVGNDPAAYAAYNNNEEIRLNSSSGGIFTLLAEHIISQGGVVFGAVFNGQFEVVHEWVDTVDRLERLRGSKYVQSRIGDTYKQTKAFLDGGRCVLFTGTPCQIGGLLSYLQKDYNNLFTQDLICHGAPSPKVWRKYVEFREAEAASKTRRTFFRHKKYGWKTFSVLFEFSNSTEYIKILTEDFYMRGFLADLYLRPSCHKCNFKTLLRKSDITLADFWGIQNMLPEMDDDKGTSLVIVNSTKGAALWEEIRHQVTAKKVDVNEAVKYNPSAVKSVAAHRNRAAFFGGLDRCEIDVLIDKYYRDTYYIKTLRLIRRVLSKVKRVILREVTN